MTESPSDPRAFARYDLDPAPRCWVSPLGRPEMDALLLDLSSGGAALSLGAAFSAGDELVLEIRRVGSTSLKIASRVVHCLTQQYGTILGCRFDAPLGEDAVKALVGLP